jgi:adenine-specific DNA-methyltransferase
VRDFLDDEDGTCRTRKPRTIWDDKELNYQNGKRELKQLLGEAPVDYPKPVGLLKKIIAMVHDQNATFMDFFAGSGTLAQAVMESNIADGGKRSFVLIQLPETTTNPRFPTIADICRERVTEATKRINDTHGTEFGFRYYTAR